MPMRKGNKALVSGAIFSRLTLLDADGVILESGHRHVMCRCSCGIEKLIKADNLVRGHTKSCGCIALERLSARSRTHGHASGRVSPTYRIWSGMIDRCENANTPCFVNYGGRGISVCARWRESFKNFLADMGERPAGMSIDRIDNDGNYEPDNCRWASKTEQGRNKRSNRLVEFGGQRLTVPEWAEKLSVPQYRLYGRLYRGWADSEIIGGRT